MKTVPPYPLEFGFLALVVLMSVAGFWSLYFGVDARPDAHHHFHVLVNFSWLALLACQLVLVAKKDFRSHRTLGLAVLLMGPLLFASTALLSVHSAQKGLASGRGDFMIVQNVGVTLELGLLLALAFALRRRRKLHGALLLGTAMLFFGIALFFALIAFVPAYRIEGPETFHRFAEAGMAGQGACLVVGLIFVARDFRNGWPLLLAALFFPLNELIRFFMARQGWIDGFTEGVGSMSQAWTFVGGFAVMLALLLATGITPGARK